MANEEGKFIHDVGVTREVQLIRQTTAVNRQKIPAGSVVTIDRQFLNSTLIAWNNSWYEVPGNTLVKLYVEPPEIFIPVT
jgi:hypothetical protein